MAKAIATGNGFRYYSKSEVKPENLRLIENLTRYEIYRKTDNLLIYCVIKKTEPDVFNVFIQEVEHKNPLNELKKFLKFQFKEDVL